MKHRVLIAKLATAVLLPVLAAVIVYSLLTGGASSPDLASGPPPGPYKGSEPPAQIRMPHFALRDHKGRVIRSRELMGKVTLVTFLDTDCTTKCPIIAAEIGDGLRSFHIVAAAETGNADIHSAAVRIFDRRGVWVSTQHSGVDLTPSNLAHDIRVALRAIRD